MVIVETKFIRENPQLRREVEDAMKFGNIAQPEAEQRVAKKNNLQSFFSSGRTATGSWTKMLKKDKEEKMAGAVMSTTAGIESKPRYSRRKKKDDDEE
tara:strand:- start:1467 stop:1760 length:294 start_codon:yes stop_codon:yes gene_type:complete